MNPDYSNNSYGPVRYSLSRKRQIINETLEELHAIQMDMIDAAVSVKERQGFPEATQVINRIRAL
jgi:hypothetical protein